MYSITANCCVFKTHSLRWLFAQKVHFPISHPVTWTKLHHAESFHSASSTSTAARAQTPRRISVTDFHVPVSSRPCPPALQPPEKTRYDSHSGARCVSVCLSGARFRSQSFNTPGLLFLAVVIRTAWYWSADQQSVWCAVWSLKSPAAMWEPLSSARTQSPFSQMEFP